MVRLVPDVLTTFPPPRGWNHHRNHLGAAGNDPRVVKHIWTLPQDWQPQIPAGHCRQDSDHHSCRGGCHLCMKELLWASIGRYCNGTCTSSLSLGSASSSSLQQDGYPSDCHTLVEESQLYQSSLIFISLVSLVKPTKVGERLSNNYFGCLLLHYFWRKKEVSPQTLLLPNSKSACTSSPQTVCVPHPF